ncbi:heavy metal-binding domain-containing protein [Sphingomonas crocodyli]|uniref:Heavy metal binding domain-containing protein n=1 Tax=Sphingomonas crocodyli TaxID=1979270 RepID=A0A437M679_9SPHN|nr:heavy metal-binding domain-containing protein [Sphingomonas crocodyli]RVT93218.1 hypothetical protein EOD43_04845 [Sphingomonas crocodyli]
MTIERDASVHEGCRCSRRRFIGQFAAGIVGLSLASCAMGAPAEGKVFDAPGHCSACGMTLIPQPASPPFEPATIGEGKGMFLAAGGKGREAKRIEVHYHRPARFGPDSPILIAIPGAGRNAADYRNAWHDVAERKGVLVAALGYPEASYDFAAYQMGGVIRNLRIANLRPGPDGRPPTVVYLKDEDIGFDPNPDPTQWIFPDFDRIFGLLRTATGSRQTGYDLFGHSAGGQILHRLALFRPQSAARRIVAANAGLYTIPDLALPQPIGLQGSGATPDMLKAGLAAPLTLLLGEADNDGESGGIQLHTPTIDRYGIDRLSRGRTFFAAGERQAKAMGVRLGWQLRTVPNVGHEYRGMSAAAAQLLYGQPA